jgi:hypothetical protein
MTEPLYSERSSSRTWENPPPPIRSFPSPAPTSAYEAVAQFYGPGTRIVFVSDRDESDWNFMRSPA